MENSKISRRTLLRTAAGLAGSLLISERGFSAEPPLRIIDTHTHFHNPEREKGWRSAASTIPDTPEALRKMVEPLGVRGTIVVETSPWMEDNQWILNLAAQNKFIVGYVGHLKPGTPEFRKQLLQLHASKIFCGIRYGNLWGWNLERALLQPDFVSDLKFMADAGLELDAVLDTPGFTPSLKAVLKLTDAVPNLRVVIDHLPFYFHADSPRKEYEAELQELHSRPQAYGKVSGVLRKVENRVPLDEAFYRSDLDTLWDVFGADRLVYGSNWPPSDSLAPYQDVLRVVREYFATKGESASKKFFWDNSVRAYQWDVRD